MPFQDSNEASGVPANSQFLTGVTDTDDGRNIDQGSTIPWPSSPRASYVYYDCTIGVMLDSGMVVHNRLPQVNRTIDSLGSTFLDSSDLDTITDKGVNLKSNDQYKDILQRMGHSRYWFRIWGQALRVGYRIPIPAIKSIGGVTAIPYDKNPQWAYNRIMPGGNYGGVILWHAVWSLWYTTLVPPINQTIPAADSLGHITGDSTPPDTIQVPFSQADSEAESSPPIGFFIGGKRP